MSQLAQIESENDQLQATTESNNISSTQP